MPKFLVRLLCCFVPLRKLRHKIREKYTIIEKYENIKGTDNKIILINENGIEKELIGKLPGINIIIKGNNNVIKIHTPVTAQNTTIDIQNDNCYIEFGPCITGPFNAHIVAGFGNNQTCIIGKDTTIVDATIILNEQSSCKIGDDCMFSGMIRIWPSDGHSVINYETGDILNEATRPLVIGNHVWVGEGVRITKNARIYDNSIVAGGAVACKDYKETCVVIAGNPGQVVKRNIFWDRTDPYRLKKQKRTNNE